MEDLSLVVVGLVATDIAVADKTNAIIARK